MSSGVISIEGLTLTPKTFEYHVENTTFYPFYYSSYELNTPSIHGKVIRPHFVGTIPLNPVALKHLYIYDRDGKLVYKYPGESKDPKYCLHSWVDYIGFTEKYQFCTKCDTKKEPRS